MQNMQKHWLDVGVINYRQTLEPSADCQNCIITHYPVLWVCDINVESTSVKRYKTLFAAWRCEEGKQDAEPAQGTLRHVAAPRFMREVSQNRREERMNLCFLGLHKWNKRSQCSACGKQRLVRWDAPGTVKDVILNAPETVVSCDKCSSLFEIRSGQKGCRYPPATRICCPRCGRICIHFEGWG